MKNWLAIKWFRFAPIDSVIYVLLFFCQCYIKCTNKHFPHISLFYIRKRKKVAKVRSERNTRCVQKIWNFRFLKKNIYLFINFYVVKAIPVKYNTLMFYILELELWNSLLFLSVMSHIRQICKHDIITVLFLMKKLWINNEVWTSAKVVFPQIRTFTSRHIHKPIFHHVLHTMLLRKSESILALFSDSWVTSTTFVPKKVVMPWANRIRDM